MEKTRCHFSIIIEKAWKILSFLIIIIIQQITEIINSIKLNNMELEKVVIGVGVFILLFIIIIIYNILLWSKTYIWVEDNTIIVERNSINKKKNTYSIGNVSNINIEQNLFERLVGTNVVKIDTNSLSKAKSTDIKIIFSKKKAMEFKNLVMSYMDRPGESFHTEDEKDENFDVVCSNKDIIMHGIYTVPIISLFIFLGTVIGFVIMLSKVSSDSSIYDFIIEAVGGIIALILLIIASGRALVKSYFNYYGFKAKRSRDMIYLTYGLLKKRIYTIPVNKINAIKIVQPTISRIFRKYHVEVINVGTGDEKNESAQLIISCSKEELKHYMSILLPEFISHTEDQIKRQTPFYFLHKGIEIILWITILIVIPIVTLHFVNDIPIKIKYIVAVLLFVLIITTYILSYFTKRVNVGRDFLEVANGAFSKTVTIIRYDKIQYLEIKQSPIYKITNHSKANIHILATIFNQVINITYSRDKVFEEIKDRIIT